MSKLTWVILGVIVLLVTTTACNGERRPPGGESVGALLVESDAFGAGETIPQLYTCDGDDVSIPLRWSEPPAETQRLALIFDDVDAPAGTWVHWVVFNIPASVRSLPEGVVADPSVDGLGVNGTNSWGNLGYGGPCPPEGAPHRYTFRLYALDVPLDLEVGASRAEVDEAMEGHVLDTGQLMGMYAR